MEKALLIPDQHIPYNDPKYWKLLLKVARYLKPKHLVIMGDFADFYRVSSHRKDPSRKLLLPDEIDAVHDHLDDLDALGVRSKYFLEGNHEERLHRYLCDKAEELYGMISVPQLFSLRERGWKFLPYRKELRLGKCSLTHDVGKAGKYANRQAADAYGTNIAIGHTHRLAVDYRGCMRGKTYFGAMLGWGGDASYIDYKHELSAQCEWQLGFGVLYLDKNGFCHLDARPVLSNYSTVVEGHLLKL